jgi:hypothetical protein
VCSTGLRACPMRACMHAWQHVPARKCACARVHACADACAVRMCPSKALWFAQGYPYKKILRILANARQRLSPRKHDLLTHPFTPPIPPSLPAIAAGVLGWGAPDSLPLICVPLPFGGAHTTLTAFILNAVLVVYQRAQLRALLQPVGVG